MSTESDPRLAEFLRRVEASGDDAAPAAVVVGAGEASEVQEPIALQFAATVRELGHVEPAGGPDRDLRRVRLTPVGREWLAEYDRSAPTPHPRFPS